MFCICWLGTTQKNGHHKAPVNRQTDGWADDNFMHGLNVINIVSILHRWLGGDRINTVCSAWHCQCHRSLPFHLSLRALWLNRFFIHVLCVCTVHHEVSLLLCLHHLSEQSAFLHFASRFLFFFIFFVCNKRIIKFSRWQSGKDRPMDI